MAYRTATSLEAWGFQRFVGMVRGAVAFLAHWRMNNLRKIVPERRCRIVLTASRSSAALVRQGVQT
jgi:hypothetical protein